MLVLQIIQNLSMIPGEKAEEQSSTAPSSTSKNPPSKKLEIEKRREKKKKNNAFKTFLNKVEEEPLFESPLRRKYSGSNLEEERLSDYNPCKICLSSTPLKSKQCQFCKESVCTEHFRKKRRNPETNKFCRICEACQDDYLYRRHLKNEMKTDESMTTQQMLMEDKLVELKGQIDGKRARIGVLKHRSGELQQKLSHELFKLTALQAESSRLQKKIEKEKLLCGELQKICIEIGKGKPPSLQKDYQYLVGQNQRITHDLVKYEKMCHDVIVARSHKEKQMYEQYYEWEQEKRKQRESKKQKDDECEVY